MNPLEWIATLGGVSNLAILARMHGNLARLERLPEVDAVPVSSGRLCICIPARNEGREIGPALDSWLRQDYPDLSILVVDDGSTDGTPALLAVRAAAHPGRLRVLRNDHLPPGWLVKDPSLVGQDSYGPGWMLKIKVAPGTTLNHLMDLQQYQQQIEAEA